MQPPGQGANYRTLTLPPLGRRPLPLPPESPEGRRGVALPAAEMANAQCTGPTSDCTWTPPPALSPRKPESIFPVGTGFRRCSGIQREPSAGHCRMQLSFYRRSKTPHNARPGGTIDASGCSLRNSRKCTCKRPQMSMPSSTQPCSCVGTNLRPALSTRSRPPGFSAAFILAISSSGAGNAEAPRWLARNPRAFRNAAADRRCSGCTPGTAQI